MNGGLKSLAWWRRTHWRFGRDEGCFGLRHRQFPACREFILRRWFGNWWLRQIDFAGWTRAAATSAAMTAPAFCTAQIFWRCGLV